MGTSYIYINLQGIKCKVKVIYIFTQPSHPSPSPQAKTKQRNPKPTRRKRPGNHRRSLPPSPTATAKTIAITVAIIRNHPHYCIVSRSHLCHTLQLASPSPATVLTSAKHSPLHLEIVWYVFVDVSHVLIITIRFRFRFRFGLRFGLNRFGRVLICAHIYSYHSYIYET